MNNKKEKYLIALAGLFHDIGKFLWKANKKTSSIFPAKDFKYGHAALSAEWIQKNKDIFENVEQNLSNILIDWGARHHNPTDELESRIMQVADWYSSAHEREKILKDELNLLHTVFERVNFGSYTIDEQKSFGMYLPSKLELNNEIIFPKILQGIIKDDLKIEYFQNEIEKNFSVSSKKDLLEIINQKYTELFRDFEDEFSKLSINFTNSLEQFFNFSYYFLQKYIWSIPASVWSSKDKNNHYPDISLFDHSRVLSAIATSLYDYAKEKSIYPNRDTTKDFDNEEAFLLIEGDIGGIQKFLFNIYKSSEAAEAEFSIAKALRGRSFFLSMIPEILARYILDELGYPITNALYIGGGKFQLLIGNTQRNKEKLEKIEKEINEYLFEEFELDLNFALAFWSFKGKEFKTENGFLSQIEYLQQEIDKKKKQKIGDLLFKDLETLEESTKEICPSCKSLKIEDNDKFCKWCEKSQIIGEIIPKINYISFSKKNENLINNSRKIINLGKFGKAFLIDDDDLKIIETSEFEEILILNNTKITEKNNGFKFLGNTVPVITKENKGIFEKFIDEETKKFLKDRNVLPFEILVKFAQGDKKLGYFRADVDNLGLIFSDGLRTVEVKTEEDESLYTISRIASLSRMLDLYFSGYLNRLVENITQEYLKKLFEILEKSEKHNESNPLDNELTNILKEIKKYNLENNFINSLIYIVYSGGDDLFIIAPYNLALIFAKKIREEFVSYTAKNPEFGVSGGLLFARYNLPINLVAKYAENLEYRAKEGTKDKIAIFQKTYKWKDFNIGISELARCNSLKEEEFFFDKLEKIIEDFEELYNKEIISRSFLYNLLTLYKSYIEKFSEQKECKSTQKIKIDPILYPKLHYQIARNVKNKENENVRNQLIIPLLNIDNNWIIKNLDTIVSLVLMKTRKGG